MEAAKGYLIDVRAVRRKAASSVYVCIKTHGGYSVLHYEIPMTYSYA